MESVTWIDHTVPNAVVTDTGQFNLCARAIVAVAELIESLPEGSTPRQMAECARRDLGRASQRIVEAK
jgi:hypothetical protein